MKITNKNLPSFIGFMLMFVVAGSLVWELLEIVTGLAAKGISLSAGPVGFDIHVISLYLRFNPGSAAGLVTGFLLFKRL